MKIKRIISQHRRDFNAVFVCESCGKEETKSGYDDTYFHQHVIPKMICQQCGKTAPDLYTPLEPKYPDGYQV